MGKNYIITNNDEQNVIQAEQTVQLYGSGVVLFVKTHTLYTVIEIPTVTINNLVGYENQTYLDLGIEDDLLNTGVISFSNFLPNNFTYALSSPSVTYNEEDNMFYLRDALQKQGHYTKVIL